jgi:hypothetical protein
MTRLSLLACLLLCGCATIRSAALDWKNADLRGQAAPALAAGEWVGEPATVPADWYLVAFFLPW